MSPRQKAKLAFASAGLLLLLSGGALSYLTIVHLLESERWVIHSFAVQAALGDVDSAMARAGRLRAAFIFTNNKASTEEFESAASDVHQKIQQLQWMTTDNQRQRELSEHLAAVVEHRIELFRNAIQLQNTSPKNEKAQGDITVQSVSVAAETTAIMQEMRTEEQRLLQERVNASRHWFTMAMLTLSGTFVLALALFSVHYRLLIVELNAREHAERATRESEESLRHLSVRLLRLQDEERRKLSRELHDSLGQYLASVKMNLEVYSRSRPPDDCLGEAINLLDQSIAETRMISYLLHPPLLDETGLVSATKWYVEGFARRSGIEVKLDIPENMGRLQEALELGLFRVLQESLTNIHRHSKSTKAEIVLTILPSKVLLTVRDHGKGIPQTMLQEFSSNGTGFGVGLAGMRERIHELGGTFEIQSSPRGTLVSVSMPIVLRKQAAAQIATASSD